jgi:PAS domain S-box-containing protein
LKTINFEALFSASPNPYVLLDLSFTIVGMNDAYLQVTMRGREDLLGRNLFETDMFRRAQAVQQANQALSEERQHLRGLFQQAPGFMAALSGPEHVFTMANTAYLQLIGRENIVGKPVREALPEVVGQGFIDLLDRVYRSGQPFVGRSMCIFLEQNPGDGQEERFLDFVYQPIYDPDGQVSGIFVQGHDVTEQKRTEEALRESEERFRAIANSIDQMIWATQPDGYHDYYNQRWYEFTGVPEGSTDGDAWNGMFHPDDQERAWSVWRHCLATGEPYHIEYRLRHRSGEYRWVLGRAQPVRDEEGRIKRWFGTCTDIHDFKQAQDALRESRERALRTEEETRRLASILAERVAELDAANEEIQRFAYIVSHDLRAPLVNVMGFTSELGGAQDEIQRFYRAVQQANPSLISPETRAAIEADLPEAIGFIRSSTVKMDKLIGAILKLSREGRRVLASEPINMVQLLEAQRHSVAHQLHERGAELLIESVPDLTSDRLAVEQIFGNLIDNSVKYLHASRVGRIVVRGRDLGANLLYEVEDNGRGIDSKDFERIFDLFRRPGVQDQQGEGIGLAHVRALVRRLGGTISVSSRLGEGSTFTVILPRYISLSSEAA